MQDVSAIVLQRKKTSAGRSGKGQGKIDDCHHYRSNASGNNTQTGNLLSVLCSPIFNGLNQNVTKGQSPHHIQGVVAL